MSSKILVSCLAYCCFLFLTNCTENSQPLESEKSYVPFPPKLETGLVKAERAKVDLTYFAKINSGEFFMGSPKEEIGRSKNERKHKVRLTRPYYMSKFEITIKEWNEVFGDVLNKETTFFLPENQIDICKWFVNQTNSGPFKKNFSS